MASKRKSQGVQDDIHAECPFTVVMHSSPTSTSSKRKRDSLPVVVRKNDWQEAPFDVKGSFRSGKMGTYFTVEPNKSWLEMGKYSSFVLNGTKYFVGDYVFVANVATIERQQESAREDGTTLVKGTTDDWVAKILQIRAVDMHHVYARLAWMYWPRELPPVYDGKKRVRGAQPYHGKNELLASNHMEIINVLSVTTKATVNHWVENDDDEIQDALYWRQAYDVNSGQLSSVTPICRCKRPANPDKTLLGCPNPTCSQWLHEECMQDDILTKTFQRLGRHTPHIATASDALVSNGDETTPKPETIKKEDTGDGGNISVEDPATAERKDEDQPADSKALVMLGPDTPRQTPRVSSTPASMTPSSDMQSNGTGSRRGRKAKVERKPYDGLFTAALVTDQGPALWRITDHREDVAGGVKTWTEPANCLICDTRLD